ncbi:MAG: AAA family ATPase, partial [Rudaea sp.]
EHTDTLIVSFIERAREANTKLDEKKGLTVSDLEAMIGLRRIASIVDRWNKLQERMTQIFSRRNKWMEIVDELFQRKKMRLTDSNELAFESRSGKMLTTRMLSSGEKQLLILLSETLLQRGAPAIFIADEPELSLHVFWQEKLVSSLRALNPSAQIVFATHSPDIVGPLSDRAIDMETLIP